MTDLRPAILRGLCYTTDAPDYERVLALLNDILDLPIMQARERVIEAARFVNVHQSVQNLAGLRTYFAELDALETK